MYQGGGPEQGGQEGPGPHPPLGQTSHNHSGKQVLQSVHWTFGQFFGGFVDLSIGRADCQRVCLSVYLSVGIFVTLFVCLFVSKVWQKVGLSIVFCCASKVFSMLLVVEAACGNFLCMRWKLVVVGSWCGGSCGCGISGGGADMENARNFT